MTTISNQNPSAQSLVDLVLGGDQPAKGADPVAPAEPEVPQPPAPTFDLSTALETATGGTIKSIEDLTALQSAAQKAAEYQQRLSELEASAANTIKPANSFVTKLNNLLQSGADTAQVQTFWKLSNTDLDQMSPIDLLVFQKQMEQPSLSPDEVKAYVLTEYGFEDDEVDITSLPAGKAAKLKIEAAAAKQKLAADRAALEVVAPQPGQTREAEQARQVQGEAAASYWSEVLTQMPVSIPFSFEDKEKGIPHYEFNFNPRPEVLASARQAVLADVAARPEAYPKTREGAEMVQSAIQNLVAVYSQEDFKRALFLDVYNAIKMQSVLSNAGPVPNRPSTAAQPEQKRKSLTEAMGY